MGGCDIKSAAMSQRIASIWLVLAAFLVGFAVAAMLCAYSWDLLWTAWVSLWT
jgi:hypothetical protein